MKINISFMTSAIVATMIVSTSGAQETAAAPPAAVTRPKYSFLRQNEDWSSLRNAPKDQLTDFWDPIKYVPLSDDGSIWASFGGDARMRLESWNNLAFGAPPNDDDTFVLWRLRLHGDVHFGDNLRVFIEGKSALMTDRDLPGGRRTLDVDTIDLEQAFVDIKLDLGGGRSLTLRPGRQSFLFGKQRLVSPLPWANTLRRWDGVGAIAQVDSWTLTGFWSYYAPVQKYDFNDSDDDIQFFGVYATGKIPGTDVGLDLYYLGLDNDHMVTFNGTAGDETRHTLGGRIFGKCGDSGFDYDLEGAYQFGEVGSGDVDAFMIGSQLGYTVSQWAGKPRFFAGVDYASGDDEPGGDVQTFNQLFPLGHAYYGYMDFVGRQNAVDLNLGSSVQLCESTSVHISGHHFLRADTSDALYNAGGGVVRAGSLSDAREIGTELDIVLKHRIDAHLACELGYSHFFAGDFIDESGSSEDMDFFYVQLEYTF